MNWEAVGAIAEALGAIAIFVSLVYVAIQIRQNTEQSARTAEASALAAFERNIDSGNRLRELLILHPEVAQLLLTGYESYKELTAAEKFRFGMLQRNIFASVQAAFVRHMMVGQDPRNLEGIADLVDSILINRGAREWLAENHPDWRPEFRTFVFERLAAVK